MNYTVDYLPDKKLVSIKIKGRLNFHIVGEYSKEALKLARENDCTSFLLDHIETTRNPGITNLHTSGDELQQFGFKNTDRIAIVLGDHTEELDFPGSESLNSHWSIFKIFYSNDIKEASDWLHEVN